MQSLVRVPDCLYLGLPSCILTSFPDELPPVDQNTRVPPPVVPAGACGQFGMLGRPGTSGQFGKLIPRPPSPPALHPRPPQPPNFNLPRPLGMNDFQPGGPPAGLEAPHFAGVPRPPALFPQQASNFNPPRPLGMNDFQPGAPPAGPEIHMTPPPIHIWPPHLKPSTGSAYNNSEISDMAAGLPVGIQPPQAGDSTEAWLD